MPIFQGYLLSAGQRNVWWVTPALLATRIKDRSPPTAYLAIKLLSRCMHACGPHARRLAAELALDRIAYLAALDKDTYVRAVPRGPVSSGCGACQE